MVFDEETPKATKLSLYPISIMYYTIYTLNEQIYFNTNKYPCTDCVIYRLKIQLGAKRGIEITGIESLLCLH